MQLQITNNTLLEHTPTYHNQEKNFIKTFLDILFPILLEGENIEIRLIAPTKKDQNLSPLQFFYSNKNKFIESIETHQIEQKKGYGIYFGVCPRLGTEGNKNAVMCANVLWADLDGKNYSGGKEEALQIIKRYRIKPTIIVDSGHGYHAYWKFKEPQYNLALVENCLIRIADELKSDSSVKDVSRVMRLPGTVNNKDEKNVIPANIIEINADVSYEIAEFQCSTVDAGNVKDKSLDKGKNWIVDSIKNLKEGSRNVEFSKLIGRFKNDGYSSEDTFAILQPHAETCGFPVEELKKEVSGIYRRYQKEIPLKNGQKEVEYSAYFEGLVDIVDYEGKPAFLIKDKEELKIKASFIVGESEFLPPPKETMAWLLPNANEVLRYYSTDSDKQLYEDLLSYHKHMSELPSEEYYDLLVAWEFHTYLLESFQYSPYIYLFAVPERGKSRTGKAMIYVSYRGVHVQSLRDAFIMRLANDHKATLFFDVKDIWRMAQRNGTEDILLCRFERGINVYRVLYPEKGAFKDTKNYNVFGPTIISTNVAVDPILDTRAIQINMPESSKQFEQDVKPEDSLKYKERLVAFRARHLGQSLLYIPKCARDRLGDILRPIHQVIRLVNPDREIDFLNLVSKLDNERKIDRSMSLEAEILTVVLNLESSVQSGILSVEAITEKINLERNDRSKLISNSLGKRLTSMGFRRIRTSDGHAAITYDINIINRLLDKYGINKPSVISESSEGSQ